MDVAAVLEITAAETDVDATLSGSCCFYAAVAAQSLNSTARIVVKNGVKTMYIYTKSMTYGNIEASLQELKVADANGNYTSATVEE